MTAENLRELLDYDASTGIFTWKQNDGQRTKRLSGSRAGNCRDSGYRKIKIGGKLYAEHRLAWLYVTGKWPDGCIDHIDGVRDHNSWSNLRDVSRSVNSQNQRFAQKHNTTVTLGVSAYGTRFKASFRLPMGGQMKLGVFKTAEDAHCAYLSAKRALHNGCTI